MSYRTLLCLIAVQLASACDRTGVETRALLNPRLALHRHGHEGSLHYTASHFNELYAHPARGEIIPIFPLLGYPAFIAHGGELRLDYMARCAHGRVALADIQVDLVADKRSRLHRMTGQPEQRLVGYDRTDGVEICRLSVYMRLADDVETGLYGLEHRAASGQISRIPGAVSVLRQPPTAPRPFTFVHLSDLHQRREVGGDARRAGKLADELGIPRRAHTPLPTYRVLRAVQLINSLRPRPDFAVLTGDIVDYGDEPEHWRASRDALARLEVPIVVLIGNHDYYYLHSPLASASDLPVRDPEQSNSDIGLQNFMRYFHPYLAPRFAYAGYRFMGLDTGVSTTLVELDEFKMITTAGVSRGQLADVASWLGQPAAYGHVLMGHTPTRTSLFGATRTGKRGRTGAFEYGADRLESLLVAAAARARQRVVYLSGHIHWNHLFNWQGQKNRFARIDPPAQPVGRIPCWQELPAAPGPLLMSTQSATKSHSLYAGWLRTGYRAGEGPGDGFGFRLIAVDGTNWRSASYRMDKLGAIKPAASNVAALPRCGRRVTRENSP